MTRRWIVILIQKLKGIIWQHIVTLSLRSVYKLIGLWLVGCHPEPNDRRGWEEGRGESMPKSLEPVSHSQSIQPVTSFSVSQSYTCDFNKLKMDTSANKSVKVICKPTNPKN